MRDKNIRDIKVLFSARDPGTAINIIPIARDAIQRERYKISIYASEPAFSIINDSGLPVEYFNAGTVLTAGDQNSENLLKEAMFILQREKPDVLFAGVSSPDAGIDEALLLQADDIRKYVIQDFWGRVNTVLGKPEAVYLVLDEDAERLSKTLYQVETRITGMPKYNLFQDYDIQNTRHALRSRLLSNTEDRLVVFFGQSLWHFEGYAKTIKLFAQVISQIKESVSVFYHKHPKETESQLEKALSIFSHERVSCKAAENFDTNEWIIASDIACTVFSNSGYDKIMFNRLSSGPLGSVIFLLFDAEISDWYAKTFGMDELPPSRKDLAYCIKDSEQLKESIEEALSPEIQLKKWQLIQQYVKHPGSALDKIQQIISFG